MLKEAEWRAHLWPEWEIIGRIGEGSYGSVYRLKRQDIGGTYFAAMKVITIHPEGYVPSEYYEEGTQTAERHIRTAEDYARELALLESLKGHTNIVSYEDHKIVPSQEGGFYILLRMELLTPLRDYMETGERTEKDIAVLGMDISRALILCEKLNIIHRDIKPENIFINRFGDFKLGDFGIAKQLDSENAMIRSRKGTLFYMAPEMYYRRAYDSRVDLYALGLVLYRYLNGGRPPFIGADQKIESYQQLESANLRRLRGETLPPPQSASDRMTRIILKACAYHPAQRYRKAEEMLLDLTRLTERQAESAAPISEAAAKLSRKVQQLMEVFETPDRAPVPDAMVPKRVSAPVKRENEKPGGKDYFKKAGDL